MIETFTPEQIAVIAQDQQRIPSANDLFVRYEDHHAMLAALRGEADPTFLPRARETSRTVSTSLLPFQVTCKLPADEDAYLSHDPGGKVRIGIESDVDGGAYFSPCGRHRHLLWRFWKDGVTRPGFVLWIGMNPSTADASVDDPTVKKERKFTKRWGYGGYVKANVMDYRATDQKRLMDPGIVPCTDHNLEVIAEIAAQAELVVLAFGSPHKKLHRHGENVVKLLHGLGKPMHCLALTKEGLPGHPLYLKDTSELMPFPVRDAA